MHEFGDSQSAVEERERNDEPEAVAPVTPDATLLHPPRATLAVITKALLSRPHGTYQDEDVRFIARLYTGH
jgi:hypothetical protein